MKNLIIGLGLMGGSLCKALKKYTDSKVYAINRTAKKCETALKDGAIDGVGDIENEDYDVIWLCQYKTALEEWVKKWAPKLKKGTILADVCGLKGNMTEKITKYCTKYEINYVGTHPMAGKEVNGYENSESDLFLDTNFIITPTKDTNAAAVKVIEDLARAIGAKKITCTTPQKHDKMIAYVSHLPHVIASSLINNPDSREAADFSGGSFRDATRVSTMESNMWPELFLNDKEALLKEIEIFKTNVEKYEAAIKNDDTQALVRLIEEGRQKKLENLKG